MISRTNCLVLILAAFLSFPAAAQKTKTPKSKTPKADAAYEMANYSAAAMSYMKYYGKQKSAPVKAEIAYKAGESYRMMGNWKEASNWYAKSVKDNDKNPDAVWRYAESLQATGMYDEAIAQFNSYRQLNPEDARTAGSIEACTNAQQWKDKPTRAVVENMTAFNTKYFDFAPSPSNVPNGIFFTSSRMEATGNSNDGWYGEKYFDLFGVAMDNNGKWSTPTAAPTPLNSSGSDGAACWDAKTNTLYFTHCEKIKGKEGMCRIMKSVYADSKWSTPEPLPFASEDYNTGHPTISADGSTMFFSSDMPGTLGGKDIFMVRWDAATSTWGTPVNLGSSINTPKDEMFPYASADNKIYFSSNGHGGMGGLDIYSSMGDGGSWSAAINLKSPMNSPGDDFGIMFDSPTSGFLTSSREGGLGGDDIYSFRMPPPVFNVSGRVYDTDTKESISGATVELFGSDGTSLSVNTGADGMYTYALKPETKYKVSASYTGYLTKFLEVTTVGLEDSKDFVGDFDFPLKSTAKPIELPEIFYDLDKATLRPESKKELDGLIKVLDENPTITIRIEAHTDTRASDQYNIDLSNRRAKSVLDYLVKNGVDKARLSSVGYGESRPRISDDEIAKMATNEEKEAAHQKNRRTEFSVLSTDFVPAKKK
ncbi:MAG TPA: OmpA family protein [Bacteroidia bacterium]|nr:OmpA family protein [Bacteroidia bacterium]